MTRDEILVFEHARKTLRNFLGVKRYLEENLHKPVDLGIESALKPIVRESASKDILYA